LENDVMTSRSSVPRSFLWIAIAYLLAAAVACPLAVFLAASLPLWQAIAVADFAATVVVFAFSVGLGNSSVYDPYWSVAPMLIAPGLALSGAEGAPLVRKIVVVGLVLVWGARLTFNWARGWEGLAHEDWRYVNIRAKAKRGYWPVSFIGIHLMPTVWVLLGCLSLFPTLSRAARPLGALDGVAFVVTAGAIALETVADEQLRAFRRAGPAPGRILDHGVWSWSRHPNYLGEVSFWWGLYLFGLAADPGAWGCIAGPASITILFLVVSIPMLDRRSLSRRPGYAEHIARVPALFPRPWRLFRR